MTCPTKLQLISIFAYFKEIKTASPEYPNKNGKRSYKNTRETWK